MEGKRLDARKKDVFQFLIGNLIIDIQKWKLSTFNLQFQFLIGNLIIKIIRLLIPIQKQFQFLIGNLIMTKKSRSILFYYSVSIPYR